MMTFTFNGHNSREYGLFIESFPNEQGGQKILDTVQIPGRTGSLTIDTGAISNVRKSYSVMFKGSTANMRAIRQWLAMSEGYCRLEDTYDPDVYRKARVVNLPTFENHINRYGRGTIEFDCDPRRFLLEGEREIVGNIQNDWMPSKPIIKVAGSGTVTINAQVITISTSTPFEIDCENMECHSGSVSYAQYVSMTEFPELIHGNNTISTSGVTVSVVPNFWMP